MSTQTVRLIVVMGVSGCGKSSVAECLAESFGYDFIEADDFHPQENIDHMASGNSLTDDMREPWIRLLQAHLKQAAKAERNCVMSFSGLRRHHRAKIRDLPFNTLFIHLEGDKQLISDRINARADHFMPANLLDSQYEALQPAAKKESILGINVAQPLEHVIKAAVSAAKQHFDSSEITSLTQIFNDPLLMP